MHRFLAISLLLYQSWSERDEWAIHYHRMRTLPSWLIVQINSVWQVTNHCALCNPFFSSIIPVSFLSWTCTVRTVWSDTNNLYSELMPDDEKRKIHKYNFTAAQDRKIYLDVMSFQTFFYDDVFVCMAMWKIFCVNSSYIGAKKQQTTRFVKKFVLIHLVGKQIFNIAFLLILIKNTSLNVVKQHRIYCSPNLWVNKKVNINICIRRFFCLFKSPAIQWIAYSISYKSNPII
jgi:hypothetical protein